MHYAQAIAALAALSSVSLATPVKLESRTGKYSVQQVASGKKGLPGAQAYRLALQKYGAHVPTSVQVAAAAAQSGSVGAQPANNDEQYVCPVTLGQQTLHLDFDTGSADLWTFSTELPRSQAGSHPLWNPSGATRLPDTWSITYGDGSGAAGNVFADKVVVGGVTATRQAIEAATSVSAQFVQDTVSDGLLGLAFSSINTVKPQRQTTFFDTVKNTLQSPLFTATLKHNAPGSYDFGYIDSSKYQGTLSYVPVSTAQGFWQFTASSSLGGSFSAIADTGTTLMLVADSIVRAYYSKVSGATNSPSQGGYIFPCTATLPNFPITIGGQNFVVPGAYINYAPVGGGHCFGGIQSSQGIGFNILGDIFLKNMFVVFDSAGPRIGFATQAGGTTGGGNGGGNGTNATVASIRARSIPQPVKLW